MVTTFVVVLVFCSLIVVHEWGHFMAAKKVGVGVEKFAVGFGKKIFSRTHKGTEYLLCAIPFGGYVKLVGDERAKCKGASDEFFSHSVWHRAFIVIMGPVINFVFAYFCFYFLFATGFPMTTSTVGNVLEDFPAYEAGILVDDKIIQIDDKKIETWTDIEQTVKASSGSKMDFVIIRDGEEIVKTIVPKEEILKDMLGQEKHVWVIGIQAKEGDFVLVKSGIGESFIKAYDQLYQITTVTFKALYRIITGAMPARGNIGGPILIVMIIKSAATLGFAHVVFITGVISASLALVNLFPVPVLDGGHLLFLSIEGIRRKPLSPKIEEGLAKVGFGLLLCLMAFLLISDASQMGWFEHIKNFIFNLQK